MAHARTNSCSDKSDLASTSSEENGVFLTPSHGSSSDSSEDVIIPTPASPELSAASGGSVSQHVSSLPAPTSPAESYEQLATEFGSLTIAHQHRTFAAARTSKLDNSTVEAKKLVKDKGTAKRKEKASNKEAAKGKPTGQGQEPVEAKKPVTAQKPVKVQKLMKAKEPAKARETVTGKAKAKGTKCAYEAKAKPELLDWQTMCKACGVRDHNMPESITKCKKMLNRYNVNIYDLAEAMETNTVARRFSSVGQLKCYSLEHNKIKARADVKKDKLLKKMLREFFPQNKKQCK